MEYVTLASLYLSLRETGLLNAVSEIDRITATLGRSQIWKNPLGGGKPMTVGQYHHNVTLINDVNSLKILKLNKTFPRLNSTFFRRAHSLLLLTS